MRDNTIQAAIRDRVRQQIDSGFELKSASPLDVEIKSNIMKTGCVIAGSGGCGKTNLVKVIARELMHDENIQLKIFDKSQNWIHNFDPIIYQDIDMFSLAKKGIYFEDQSILYNRRMNTPAQMKETISNIVGYDYDYQWELKQIDQMDRWLAYIIEEAQNILGTIGLNDIWNTFISEGRNFNMSFMFITRRMAQLSPKAREQTQSYLWGRTVSQLDLDRIRRVSTEEVAEALPTLNLGEFIYWDGEVAYKLVGVPKFESTNLPTRWEP